MVLSSKHSAKGGKSKSLTQLWTLSAALLTFQARYAPWINSGNPVRWVTNGFLIGTKACST